MIRYTDSIENITPEMLEGFFDGWRNRPSRETHLKILKNSKFVVLAIDDSKSKVVGFISAISDGILCAYIPLLEVLAEYGKKGIGKELTTRMLAKLNKLYMIDLTCDKNLEPFYASCGMSPAIEENCTAMMVRNYERQSGKEV